MLTKHRSIHIWCLLLLVSVPAVRADIPPPLKELEAKGARPMDAAELRRFVSNRTLYQKYVETGNVAPTYWREDGVRFLKGGSELVKTRWWINENARCTYALNNGKEYCTRFYRRDGKIWQCDVKSVSCKNEVVREEDGDSEKFVPKFSGRIPSSFKLKMIDDPLRVSFRDLITGLSAPSVHQAIISGGIRKEWDVVKETDGSVELKILVRGRHKAHIAVDYTTEYFDVRYLDSADLDYADVDISSTRTPVMVKAIHGNYNGWIRELGDSIRTEIKLEARKSAKR